MNIAKENLLERGFKEIGTFGGLECLAKKVADSEKEFAYFMFTCDGIPVSQFAQSFSTDDIDMFIAIKEKLTEDVEAGQDKANIKDSSDFCINTDDNSQLKTETTQVSNQSLEMKHR